MASQFLTHSKARDMYGPLYARAAFHTSMLEAGIRRVEGLVATAFGRPRFLQLLCRSAMRGVGRSAHTILLESFGVPLLVLRNLGVYNDSVFVIHVEEAYAEWKARRVRSPWILGGFCVAGILLAVATTSFPFTKPHQG